MAGKGEFFQIDRRAWHRVCALGLNPAVAYLILATGTGGDNRTTSWSTNAIENYTGIGRGVAKTAVAKLIAAKVVTQIAGGTKPRYYLEPAHLIPECEGFPPTGKPGARGVQPYDAEAAAVPDWIWIPNTLVMAAGTETPPVERVRRKQDVRMLRLLIDLYHAQALPDAGGIHWRQIRQTYQREQLTERGRYIL
jgi:hypothetical protein